MSAKTSIDLNLIEFLNTVSIPDELFTKGGKIKDVQVKLHIDESVIPVAQKPRRIPFHIRKDVEDEIKSLQEQDIIEDVDGPTPWVSPVVAVPKKSGGIRLCVDMREANKAIVRERHPMPTIEEILTELNGSTTFSRIYM